MSCVDHVWRLAPAPFLILILVQAEPFLGYSWQQLWYPLHLKCLMMLSEMDLLQEMHPYWRALLTAFQETDTLLISELWAAGGREGIAQSIYCHHCAENWAYSKNESHFLVISDAVSKWNAMNKGDWKMWNWRLKSFFPSFVFPLESPENKANTPWIERVYDCRML